MKINTVEPKWLVTANIVENRPYGPGGKEIRNGTKLFRGGAKVYIVGAHAGMCEDIIVLGHHRKSGKFIQSVIKVYHVENIRMTLCYSPTALKKVAEEYFTSENIPTKLQFEQDIAMYKSWQKGIF